MQSIIHFVNGLQITVPQEVVDSKESSLKVGNVYYFVNWAHVMYVIPAPAETA